MTKALSERNKKIVDKTIDKIRSGEIDVYKGYDKFVNNMFGGKAFVYYIEKLEELNMITIDKKGMMIANNSNVWK